MIYIIQMMIPTRHFGQDFGNRQVQVLVIKNDNEFFIVKDKN